MFDTTTSESIYSQVPSAYLPRERQRARRRNYRAPSKPETLRKQERIRAILGQLHEGLTVSEVGRALGMSRQLALYHLKKMAASGAVVMVLEPCAANGGVQFRCWDEMALAAHYSRMLIQTVERSHAA
jgi:DNA-binding transcriptional ArsR family regulator